MTKKVTTIDDITTHLFDAKTITRQELIHTMKFWYPAGSGPISAMKVMYGLFQDIAELRGFEPITLEEIRLAQFDQPTGPVEVAPKQTTMPPKFIV